ncbi:hypothetical protein [Gracilibacillus xinjiangensis]|uniref:Transposase n=1 Tax=Gracilibacillus xinjiangensis TaxID=1193282 RepID=A0ABV8WXX3_9BACI
MSAEQKADLVLKVRLSTNASRVESRFGIKSAIKYKCQQRRK